MKTFFSSGPVQTGAIAKKIAWVRLLRRQHQQRYTTTTTIALFIPYFCDKQCKDKSQFCSLYSLQANVVTVIKCLHYAVTQT